MSAHSIKLSVACLLLLGVALIFVSGDAEATDPTWVAEDIATSADNALGVFVADMDGDGDLDIVSVSADDDTIAWYENDGASDPSWTAEDIATNADGACGVFVADMDGDGDLDIVSASSDDDTIAWYENDGASDPSWTAEDIATNAEGAWRVFVADMDGDGDLDIVSASYGDDTIAWYENDGASDPSWTAEDIETSADYASDVFVADMDGDGDLDIVSASFDDDTIAWYENDGASDPSWTAEDIETSADGAIGVFVADMDGDGDLDIVSASYLDDTIAWYENDGASDPSWTAEDIATSADAAWGVFVADMDGDGDLDIVSASYGDDTIAWYENDGASDPSWTAEDIATSADGAASVFVADMDGDGDLDIVSASSLDDTIAWYETTLPEWSYDTDEDILSVSVTDDGEYIAAGTASYVYLFDKDSSTPLWKYDIGVRAYAVDMSSGGEYIAVGSDSDKVYLFARNSSTPLWTYETEGNVRAIAISVDGEYIAAGSSDGKIYLFDKDSSTPLWSYDTDYSVLTVDISADGKYITVGTSGYAVYLFDKDSSTPLWSYTDGDGSAHDVSISADGEYIVSCSGDDDKKVRLFHKDSSTPLWTYTTDGGFTSDRSCDMSADGEYIAVGNTEDDNRLYLFDKDSSTPLWYYSASDNVYDVSISKDGKYIVAADADFNIHLFDKDSNVPLWTYAFGYYPQGVSISADGKYIAGGGLDDSVYLFKNSLADRPSIIPYGPRSGSEVDEPVTLRWFAGSDDRDNLTFDVYLGTTKAVWPMDTDLSDANASYIGEDGGHFSGAAVSGVGDVNGDGYDDFLIGAYSYNTNTGQTYLILGDSTGGAMDTDLSDADASFIGEGGGIIFSGAAVSGVGDVNGDGYDDFIIGAHGGNAGKTYLILGKASGWAMDTDLSDADASFIGEGVGDRSGKAVSGAGDVNGDGYDDFIIGAYGDDDGGNWAGQTYLILGKASGWATDTDLSDADASFIGEGSYDRSGLAVSGAGDVNGDGYDDFIIGAYKDDDGGSEAGQTYLILGKSSGWSMDTDLSDADASFIGEESGDFSGAAVSGAGDVNGDGYDDFLIGAPENDDGGSEAGQTYLILGKSSGWSMDTDLSDADASFIGEDSQGCSTALDSQDRSGCAVSGAGDVNGDGYDDFLIGVNGDDDGGSAAGQTYLIMGKASGWAMDTDLSDASSSFWGEDSDDFSGFAVSGAGDVNGDGYDDFLIGAYGDDDGGGVAGQTYLMLGRSSQPKVADDITTLTYTPNNLAMNTKYYWKVVATDPSGSITSSVMNFTVEVAPEWSYDVGDEVRSVAVSADGEYIVGGTYDGYVYLFKKDNSTPLWNYEVGGDRVFVDISADGEYIVTGSTNGKIYLFKKSSNNPLWDYTTTSQTTAPVAISADGESIAAASGSKIYLFDKDSSTPLWDVSRGTNPVYSIDISDDGEYIAAGSQDDNYNLFFFSRSSSNPVWEASLSDLVISVDISADGEYLVAGSYGDKIYLYHKDSNTSLWNYDTEANIRQVSISSNGEYIVAGSANDKVYLFGRSNSTPIWDFTADDDFYTAQISEDGNYIVAGTGISSSNNKVFFFDRDSGTPLWSYETQDRVLSVSLSADGKYISAGSWNDNVYTFKNNLADRPSIIPYGPRSGSEVENPVLRWFTGSDDRANLTFDVYLDTNSSPTTLVANDTSALSYTPSGLLNGSKYYWKVVATDSTGSKASSVMFFTIPTTPPTPEWSYEMDDDGLTTATSQDGKYIVVGSKDDHVYLFQSNSSTPIWKYDTGKNVNSVAISADGWSIVAGSANDDIMFWHRDSSTPVWEYDTGSDVLLVDITSDGNYVVATNEAKRIYHFNTDDDTWDSYKYLWRDSTSYTVTGMSLADNGMSLSIAAGEKLYFIDLEISDIHDPDVEDDSKWYAISYEFDFISTALSSDGEYVVASIWGGEEYDEYQNPEIRLWNRDSNNYEWKKEIDGNATTLAISANGEYIVAGCDDDKVYLFDKDSSTPLWSYDTGADVTSVSISASGQFIVAGQEDGELFLFNKGNSGTPLWNYTNPAESSFVSVEISKDGEIISATGEDDKLYVFNNNAGSSLSVIPYGPIHGEILYPDDTLRWYWSSNDEDNLVFDVYIGNSSTSLSKVASNLTTNYYQPPGNLEVHTYHYWKVVAKDSSGTSTSDVKILYKRWWWSYINNDPQHFDSSAISADGEYIVAGSRDDKVYFFDKDSSTPEWSYNAGDDIEAASISADGEYIAVTGCGGPESCIYLFDKDSSTPIWSYETDDDNRFLKTIVISSDGGNIAAGTTSGLIYYWNRESSTPLWIHDTGSGEIRDLSMSADGKYIVAAAGEYVYLFGDTNNTLWEYEAEDEVYAVEISADGEYIITGDDDETIYFFNKDSNDPIWDYEPDGKPKSVDISSDGEYMVVSTSSKIYVFDKDSSTPLWSYSSGNKLVGISEDGEYVFSTASTFSLWDRASSTLLWSYATTGLDQGSGFELDSSASGRYIYAAPTSDYVPFYLFENIEASEDFLLPVSPRSGNEVSSPQLIWFAGSDDRANLTFDVYLGTNASSLTKVADDITTLNYSPSNLVSNTTYYWKVVATDSSGSITSSVMNFTVAVAPEWSYDTGNDVSVVAVSSDGEYIVAGNSDYKIYLFDKDSSTPLWSYTTGLHVVSVAISADGEYIAAGSEDGKVYVFDKDSSTPLWSYEIGSHAYTVDISADGEYIAAGSLSGSNIYLFDKDSSTPLWSYSACSQVKSISISADGEYIAAGCTSLSPNDSPNVYLFNKDSSAPLWNYTTGDAVFSVAISADGEYIVAGSDDNKVYLFDKGSSNPLWSYQTGYDVKWTAISADGEYIVAGSNDEKAYLFDKDSSTPLWSYDTDNSIVSVSISADGEYILVGSAETGVNNVYLFDKNSSTPLWSYSANHYVDSVTISADGKYMAAGSRDDNVYTFKNSLANRPSLLAYGPREGSNTDTDPQLGWFAGSDDRSNLTFDVYLDTDSDPDTKVADDITTLYYNTQCLTLDTKYYWKVVATDGDDTVTSSVMNFTVTSYGNIFCISIDDVYDPDTLTIKKGSTVIWTNDDDSLHTVTEDDDDFDSGSISPGNSWSYTFDTVGIYDYYDQYDDDYDGQIIVLTSYPPTATISSISPQIAELYNSVSFSGSGSDPDGTISEYKWISSIDGDLSTSASFSTTDMTFGNHTITFRVKDNDGVWSDNVTSWVDVRKSPEWSYSLPTSKIAISADGEFIVSGDSGAWVRLFDKDSSAPLWTSGFTYDFYSVAISSDGSYIVAGGQARKVYLFEKDSSTPLWTYDTGNNVGSVAISADGEYIVAGNDDNKVYLFGKDSSSPLWSYETGSNINSISISANGEYIVAVSDKVYLFDKDDSTPLWSYSTGDSVVAVSISVDGEYIAVGSDDEKVYLFDKDSSTPLWSYETGEAVRTIAISSDGEYITAGSEDDNIYFFDKDSNTPLWSYATGGDAKHVSISADGEYIVAGSSDNKIYFFGKDGSTPLWNYTVEGNVNSVAISADGEYLVASTSSYNRKIYTFRNDPVFRPSVITYGPRSGSETLHDTTLGWFPGSDDITNLTFDVYLSWVKNDVLNNNSAALVADDITNYTHFVTNLTESKKYYWKVVATDGTGSATSKLMNFTVLDTTPPIANITSGPSDPSDSRNATFNFTANENDVTFQCKMDTGDWHSCSSPKTYTNLSDDTTHQFQVKATDSSNNTGSAVSWIWDISDLTAPVASISSGPSNPSHNQTASFSFSSNEDDSTFQCKLDSGSWSSCSSPKSYTSLTEGNYVFKVRATDESGNTGSPTTYSWTIDFSIVVDKNGNGDYTSISSALANATSANTIKVWAGTYYENLIVNKSISLLGNGTNTIINGSYSNYTVWVSADGVVIDGFIIEGTHDSSTGGETTNNSAIVIYYADNVTLSNISFRDNTRTLYFKESHDAIIEFSSFVTNNFGIYLSGSDRYLIHHNNFSPSSDNCIHHIYGSSSDSVSIHNNTMGACWTGMWLPGVSDSIIRDNVLISDNRSGNGISGTGYYNKFINNTIKYFGIKGFGLESNADNNLFEDNYLEDNGFDFSIQGGSENNTVVNSIFSKVYVDNTSSLIIKNYLSILVTLDNGTYNVNNADVLIKDNDNVIHASSGFGGSDPKTDNGTIQTYLITDRIYNANSTATENITTIKILHGTSISRSVNMSTTHTESINVDRKSIWVVDINGSGDFTTIQQAVTVAREGNELRIWSGVYREKIVVDKALTLTGNGSESTKIVGNISQFENTTKVLVHLTSDDIVFQKINITLESRGTSSSYFNTLLRIVGDDITLNNNSFYYNITYNSINGIYCVAVNGDNVNISKNKFYNSEWAILTYNADYGLYYNNTFVGPGSHMEIHDSSYNIVENNTFYYASFGLAIHDYSTHNILRYNTLIYSSNGTTSLGEVGLTVGSHSADNVLFGNYVSDYKHGIVFRCRYNDVSPTACEDNTIENNTVDDSKYGITLYANATNNVIIDNVVRNSEKYGIYIQASASSNTFIDNRVSNSDDYDLFVDANSTGNIFIDSDIGNYSIHSSSSLALMNYLETKVQGSNSHPLSGVDIRIVTGNDIQYSSSHYGGNDAQTDSSGEISEQLLAYRTYEGNTSTNHTTQLYVWYEGTEKVLNLDMTSHRHETINLSFLIVDKNGNGHYTTLEGALSNASAGDTVRVWAGTYYENIIVNKTISFLGNGTNTIINGSYSNYTVWINADRVHIDGFIVEGTLDSTSTSTPQNNSAIVVYYTNNVTVSNISFRDNTQSLLIHNSDYALIEYSSFVTNQSGIFSVGSDSYVIHHNDFSPNPDFCGQHIYNSDGGFNGRINNNTIGACWTGMWLPGITYSVVRDNILISDNRSSNGIALTGHHNSIINNTIKYFGNKALSPQGNSDYNLFKNNYLEGNYYGFQIETGSDNNTITNNVIKNSIYGMEIKDSSENHIHNNTISGSDKYGIYILSDQYTDSSPNNIRFNNIVDSGQYAMFAKEMVNATYNWWGNSTGPGGAGAGSGDAINNRSLISYSPWLCVPADSDEVTYCTDEDPPVVTISSGPDSFTSSQSATFRFSVNENNATIQCKLDSGSWGNCTSPKSYSNLSEGGHTFSVKATDIFDNIGATVYYNWTIDYTDPITTITSGPDTITNSTSATFQFAISEDNSTSECRVSYQGGWDSCTSPITYDGLNESNPYSFTFYVRTTDQAGNLGNTATYTWTTDYTAPVVTLTSYPPSRTNNQVATFNFTADESAILDCSFNNSAWYSCTGPVVFSNLSEASYSFKVRGTDEANNTGSSVTHDWVVDITRPVTYIYSGPSSLSNSDDASFSFYNNEENGTINNDECNLDGEDNWSACSSPVQYDDLSDGDHAFMVRTTDEAGNVGDVVEWEWTIDTEPPVATILDISPQIAYFNITEVSFSGNGTDQIGYITAYEWYSSYDGHNTTLSTSSNFTTGDLPAYNHTITFRVRDNSGFWSDYATSWVHVSNGTPFATIESFNYTIVNEGSHVDFYGSGYDIDGIITQYRWESSRDGIISESQVFTTTSLSVGYHTISLRVKDNDNQWSDPAQVTLRINAYPMVHDVLWGSNQVYRNEQTPLFVYAEDPDGDGNQTPSIEVQYLHMGETVAWLDCEVCEYDSNGTGEIHFVPDASFQARLYDFRLIVTDSDNASIYHYFNQSLEVLNNLPAILEIIYSGNVVNHGDLLYLTGISEDDREVVMHEWLSDLQGPLGTNETISVDFLNPGIHLITYRVMDDDGAWTEDNVEIRINGLPHVDDIILSSDLLMEGEELDAQYVAGDDIGIAGQEWYLDGEIVNSFGSGDYLEYYLWGDNYSSGIYSSGILRSSEDWTLLVNMDAHPGSTSILDLGDSKVCVAIGTYAEYVLADYFSANGITYEAVNSEDAATAKAQFEDGTCESWVGQRSDLIEQESNLYRNAVPNSAIMPDNLEYPKIIQVEAQYDQYPAFRSNKEPVQVGVYTIPSLDTSMIDRTITFESIDIWWEVKGDDYTPDCEWTFYIHHNDQVVEQRTVNCQSDGEELVNETHYLGTSIYLAEGDSFSIEIWYEGWENVDIYMGPEHSKVRISVSDYSGPPDETPPNQLHLADLEPGLHTLSVRVRDTDEVWSETYGVEFRVNGEPTAIIDSVTSNVFHKENPRRVTVDIIGRGLDDIGINTCEWNFEYLDSELFDLDIPSQDWTSSPPCSQMGVSNFTAGNYSFSLRVEDTFGFWSEWFTYEPFYVDDGDNISFELDEYPLDNTQWFDRDKDGCGDNQKGTNGDAFPQDPTECLDTDGDGIGDNSDRFPNIHNLYLYGSSTVTVALLGAALAEMGARRSIPGLIQGLEDLGASGISDTAINKAIEDLETSGGLQYFSSERADAVSLIEKYADINTNATTSMNELQSLRNELDMMEASGISSPDILAELDDIEEMLSSQVESDTNSDYLETLKEISKKKEGD